MAKQLNVDLSFTANTKQAETSLHNLQRDLDKLLATTAKKTNSFNVTQEIVNASKAAAQLKVQLEQATNVHTGKLDLGKFSESLKKSNISLQQYQKTLSALGPDGKQAFSDLARNISMAEMPLKRTNEKLHELGTVLKNTVKWQISSSILHGFMGAVQGAYGYAKDLNESLNNIRIVTGQSVDQMARFAAEANQAAKALNTTTTAYTNASLIYYQQGLNSSEVKERTDVTIKMANVARESAEIVSDQMTAVWNNFNDGSKSLEYYADVMTALGAATASSTSEISEGLNKFAAIANTVGLSYEYATSALATVTATTRQSADIVGTAFKTMFARIQGLKLGETLEDGTTLNKYSEALASVGVNIKTVDGQLKDMDTILAEMAGKWQTISKDSQVALAQAVAGTRQYTQLVALMDNWDFMESNLNVANTSVGTLTEQANIYKESWEASSKRVKASMEELYSSLINDDFFISLNDSFANLAGGFAKVVKGAGGFKSILLSLGSIATIVFRDQILESLNNIRYSFQMMTKNGRNKLEETRKEANQALFNNISDGSISGNAATIAYKEQATLQQTLLDNAKNMSEEQRKISSILLDQQATLAQEVIESGKLAEQSEHRADEAEQNLVSNFKDPKTHKTVSIHATDDIIAQEKALRNLTVTQAKANSALKRMSKIDLSKLDATKATATLTQFAKSLNLVHIKETFGGETAKLVDNFSDKLSQLKNGTGNVEDVKKAFEDLKNSMLFGDSIDASIGNLQDKLQELVAASMGNSDEAQEEAAKRVNALMQAYMNAGKEADNLTQKQLGLKRVTAEMSQQIQKMVATQSTGQIFLSAAGSIGTIISLVRMLSSAVHTLTDDSASGGEKVMAVLSTIGMAIPMITSLLGDQNKTALVALGLKLSSNIAAKAGAVASTAEAAANMGEAASTNAQTVANLGLLATMPPLLLGVLAITAAAVALVAIIGGITAAVKYFKSVSPEGQLKKAKENAEALDQQLEETKTAVNDLTSAFEEYDSVIETLNNCTIGTEEWNTALQKVNDTVLDLLAQYPSLASLVKEINGIEESAFYQTENGVLGIRDWAREELIAATQSKQNIAYSASIQGHQNVRDKESVVRKNELASILQKGGLQVHSNKYGSSNDTNRTYEQAANVLANLIYDKGKGAVTDEVIAEFKEQARISNGKFNSVNVDDILDSLTQVENVRDALQENKTAIEANTAATKAENLALTNSVLSNNEKIVDSGYLKDASSATANAYDAFVERAKKQMDEDIGGAGWGKEKISKADGANSMAKTIFAEYAKAAGLEGAVLSDTTGTDNNRKFIYTDSSGEEKTVALENMQATVAAAKANELLNNAAEKLVVTFERLDASGTAYDQSLKKFLTDQNFENATYKEINDLQEQIKDNPSDYLNNKFGGEDKLISDEEAQQYGYDTADEFITAFNDKLAKNQQAWDALTANLPKDLPGLDALTLNSAKKLQGIFNQINLGPAGKAAGEQFVNGISKMLQNVKVSDQEEVLNSLYDIDWNSWDALDQAKKIMHDLGYEIDISSEEWRSFADSMRIATGATPDFSALKNQLVEINGLLAKLKTGGIIDEDDYQSLISYNGAWKDLFITQADGTKQFIGNAAEMAQATRNQINDAREELPERKKMHEQFDTLWGHQEGNARVNADYGSYDGTNGTAFAQQLLDSDGVTEQVLSTLGYDDDKLSTILAGANSGDEQAIAQLTEMFHRIDKFTREDVDVISQEMDEMIASTANSLTELNQLKANGEVQTDEAYAKQATAITNNAMLQASTINELDSAAINGISAGADISYDTYAASLMRLSEQYNNCANEAAAYESALHSGDALTIKAAEDSLKASTAAGEYAKAYSLSADAIERYAEELKASGKYSSANKKALVDMAKDQMRFDRAVNSCSENIQDWNKDLKVAEKTGHLVSETAEEMANAYGDLLDIDGSSLSSTFLNNTDNLELMQKALKGDEEAYEQLRAAAQADIETQFHLNDSDFQDKYKSIYQQITDIRNNPDIEVGANLNDEGFLQGLSDMVTAAGMTAEQATDYLSSMGLDATVVNKPETTDEVVGYNLIPRIKTVSGPYGLGHMQFSGVEYESIPVHQQKTINGTALQVTSASKSSGGGIKFAGSTPANGGSNKKSGGGGGSKPKKTKVTKKSDVVDRYKEIDDSIDNLTDSLDKANKSADRLYGNNRIHAMQKINDMIQEEIKLNEKKYEEAEKYLVTEDLPALQEVNSKYGTNFQIDSVTKDISNYESEMNKLYNELHAAEESANADGNATEEETEAIQKIQDKIDAAKKAISQYDETKELMEDLEKEHQDLSYEQQDNNADILSYKLELDLELTEEEKKKTELELKQLGDDFYKMGEAAALTFGKFDQSEDIIERQKAQQAALTESYKQGEISQQAYIEGLKASRDAIYDELNAMVDLDNEMKEYYGNTLAASVEELTKYTDRMQHQTAILQHYQSLMDIMGKSTDYEAMGVILEGQAKTIENEAKVAKESYEMYQAQADEKKKLLDAAIAAGDTAAAAIYQEEWEAAEAQARESQDNMLAKTEEWAESLKAVLQNKLDGLGKTLEEALTGGKTFDQLATAMERAESLQEEYLTNTNKIYETNKLMNTAQKDMDATNNTVAKRKLQSFMDETQQLQNQSRLSSYELEIQQAKYDLLLAEIALQDAQDAKSMVRLKRDSEGNFGYVYTADANKQAEAEQNLEDAQNSLYNIGLEGANNYTQKYQETISEMYDTFRELQEQRINGAFETEEEYNQAVIEAKEYYYAKLKDYSNLYQVAITADSRVVADAWSTDFADMTYNTEEWKEEVEEYLSQVGIAFGNWDAQMENIANTTLGGNLDKLKEKTSNITTESDKLVKKITDPKDGVLKAINDELASVSAITGQYASWRDTMLQSIQAHKDLIAETNKTIQDTSDGNNEPENNPEDNKPDNNTPETNQNNTPAPEPTPSNPALEPGKDVTLKTSATNFSRNGGNGTRMSSWVPGSSFTVLEVDGEEVRIGRNGQTTGWVNKRDIEGFDTGGYTGAWGPDGRFALLHQKELVLNESDTANLLTSVEMIREIARMIDLQSNYAQLSNLTSPSYMNQNSSDVLEQNVKIEAHFPNATDHSEIEEAFSNLVNRASQYINRK